MTTATPQILPKDLPDDLLKIFIEAQRHGGSLQQKNAPTPDEFDDVEKIAELGLGNAHVRDTKYPSLHVTTMSKQFTSVVGSRTRGWYATIRVEFRGPDAWKYDRPQDWPLLATAFGADFQPRDKRVSDLFDTWRLEVSHDTATDFEHDRAKLLLMEVESVVPAGFMYAPTVAYGARIKELRAYPYGTTLEQMQNDENSGECEDTKYYGPDHEPHPFIAYTPDEHSEYNRTLAKLVGRAVYIELTPVVLVDETGRLKKEDD